MPFTLFHNFFLEIAEVETRTITLFENTNGLPKGNYALMELYCDEEGCDCRRVFFSVISSVTQKIEAVIAFGWETPEFYARLMRYPDPQSVRELIGPILNPMSPQSKLAPALLKLVQDTVLKDPRYIERLKRHYQIFRQRIDGAATPSGNDISASISSVRPASGKNPISTVKIGRNDPCPCGSGKKYKVCCMRKTEPNQPTPPKPGPFRFEPGSYHVPGGYLPSIACYRQSAPDQWSHHFVIVCPAKSYANEAGAVAQATDDLAAAFERKKTTQSDAELALYLSGLGYFNIPNYQIAK